MHGPVGISRTVSPEVPHNADYGVSPTGLWGHSGGPDDLAVQVLVRHFLTGFGGNTANAYRRDLACYLRHCQNAGLDPLTVRAVHLNSYLRALSDAGRSPATVARRQVALRGFYGHLVDEQILSQSPAARLRTRRPRSLARIPSLSTAQLRALLQEADDHGPRASALAWLLGTTGLRISEACGLRREDVTVHDGLGWADVSCKGGTLRTIPLPAPALTRLAALTAGHAGSGLVFVTRSGAPWDRHAAARTLRVLAARAGIEPFSPHLLRHTFVTLARQNGCALEDVQDCVGHADPATTRRYDHTPFTHARHPATALLASLQDRCPTGPDAHDGEATMTGLRRGALRLIR